MGSSWFDEIDDDDAMMDGAPEFYCPYTNAARCALLIKGWQPQELCLALECEQVKLLRHKRHERKQHKAA